MTPTRNNRGVAPENGAIEGPHAHLKRSHQQALLLRGSSNFADLASARSMLITANQPFADWSKVVPDHAMMIAAIDR